MGGRVPAAVLGGGEAAGTAQGVVEGAQETGADTRTEGDRSVSGWTPSMDDGQGDTNECSFVFLQGTEETGPGQGEGDAHRVRATGAQ